MFVFSIMFLVGVLLLQHFSYLPGKEWVGIIIIIVSSIFIFCYKYRTYSLIPLAILLGFAWCLWYAHGQLAWKLPTTLEGKTVEVEGYVASIPSTEDHITSFLFSVKAIYFEKNIHSAKGLLKLSWRGRENDKLDKILKVGDQWRLTVRLKQIHGLMNPGGFDYEAHAFHEGIKAGGYVVDKSPNTLLTSHWYSYPLARAREHLKIKIENNLPVTNTSPWILALTIGERHGIHPQNWEVLRKTGTNHLMAIAGLHIGFMSSFAFAFFAWVWRCRERLALAIPSQHIGALAALSMGLIYSAMAGFSIPTQRACIMLTVFLVILLLRRKTISWHAWSIALLLVLLINPLSVLTESFWLSFGAVALIIYGVSARLSPKGLWWKWGRIQWVIAVGLIPFSIWLFQQCSIVSFIANSVAIPIVGFLIVPLCLFGGFIILFSDNLGGLLLTLADKILSGLWIILTLFSHLSWSSWYQMTPSYAALIIGCFGIILLLLPQGFPGRYLGFVGLLPLFFYQIPGPKSGDAWITLLDVGQGLASVVQTQHHTLVYDTGAKLSPNYDMGESVVIPFLRSVGSKKVDMLVVSHGDNDHIGGAHAIINRMPVLTIKSSDLSKLPSIANHCLRGESWIWDNVTFQFLYPSADHLGLNNDSSCVLRITVGDKHILFTGDIEKFAEKYLIEFEKKNLKANIIVVPHHGSKTSGLHNFLEEINPTYALFPLGYRNRYHFPHKSIVEKYELLGATQLYTARTGAITFKVSAQNPLESPSLYRNDHQHYWNHVFPQNPV